MSRGKNKKSMQTELFDDDGASQTSSPSSVMEYDDDTHARRVSKRHWGLKEQREFRKDNSQQLKEIREEINKNNTRIEVAERRIDATETW